MHWSVSVETEYRDRDINCLVVKIHNRNVFNCKNRNESEICYLGNVVTGVVCTYICSYRMFRHHMVKYLNGLYAVFLMQKVPLSCFYYVIRICFSEVNWASSCSSRWGVGHPGPTGLSNRPRAYSFWLAEHKRGCSSPEPGLPTSLCPSSSNWFTGSSGTVRIHLSLSQCLVSCDKKANLKWIYVFQLLIATHHIM